MLIGQCACGAVQFAIEDDFVYAGYCHCARCRAATGSAFGAFAGIERAKLSIVAGSEQCTVFINGAADLLHFCGICSSMLFSVVRSGEFVHVSMGTLLDAPRIRPSFHCFVGSKAPWHEITGVLPQYVEHAPAVVMAKAAHRVARDLHAANFSQTSRTEYARRLQRVLDYIDQHLDASLDLEALADVAHFSPFHFHRVFAAWMGQTLGDYLRSRRLDVAATRLAGDPSAAVLDVALSIGFGSGEAFARAFKVRFASTPSAWRAEAPSVRTARITAARTNDTAHNRNPDQFVRDPSQASVGPLTQHDRSEQFFAEMSMKVKVVDFPATRVAYLRTVGPVGATVGTFWRETVLPWIAANGLADQPRYGIGLDNPAVTAPEKCRYDACVEVLGDFIVSKPAAITVLPAGRYAVRSFKGTPATINDAWNEVFRDWLPSSAMQIDPRPCIEYYPAKQPVDMQTGAFECELWVPVKPL